MDLRINSMPFIMAALLVTNYGNNHLAAAQTVIASGFRVNLGNPVNVITRNFQSHTIDSSILSKPEQWYHIVHPSTRLVNLLGALSPAYLRFGGIQADYTIFNETGHTVKTAYNKTKSNALPPLPSNEMSFLSANDYTDTLSRNDNEQVHQRAFNRTITRKIDRVKKIKLRETSYLSGKDWDNVNEFVRNVNWTLLYCLNSHLRNPNGTWNATNPTQLIDYTVKRGYRVDWSLGNEPHRIYNITSHQLAHSLIQLKQILKLRNRNNDKIVAPDFSVFGNFGKNILNAILTEAGESVSAISFHHYYGNGRTISYEDLVDPDVLNYLLNQIRIFQEAIRKSPYPNIPLWITETGSAYGGGSSTVSKSFAGAIAYADKLALCAQNNIKYVMRQSLFGGKYSLFNLPEIEPNPEYWVSVLHKHLMGEKVQSGRTNSGDVLIRLYAQKVPSDSPLFPPRSVTVFVINLSDNDLLLYPDQEELRASKRYDFYLTPTGGDMSSNGIQLNGENLFVIDDKVPPMVGVEHDGHLPITLQSLSMGYFVYALQ